MNPIVKPNYNNSILNMINSIINHYGITPKHPTLETLDTILAKEFDNVVLMIFDGMGHDILKQNLAKDSFLNINLLETITSVYPCTTTAAMTTLYTALSPLEHGWLGWSLYFKEVGRTIDAFLNRDSYTGESIGDVNIAKSLMEFETIFDQIMGTTNHSVQTFTIGPEGIVMAKEPTVSITANSLNRLCLQVRKLIDHNNDKRKNMNKADFADLNNSSSTPLESHRKFIMTYWPDPDSTIHETGCFSSKTSVNIHTINRALESLVKDAEDTLFIISADHGMTDIESTIYLEEYPNLMDSLIMPPFIEPRCASFIVKKHKYDEFASIFNQYFKDDFHLLAKEVFMKEGYLGTGKNHEKVDDFIGDYVAVATGHKMIKYRTMNLKKEHHFIGHHAGMLEEEMMVPLIVVEG